MRKTSTSGPVFNGPVLVEVDADTPEKAIALAKTVVGLVVDDSYSPVPMGGGTYILSGHATNVSVWPSNMLLWPKAKKQMT
mgnify:CR=1 FL=1